MTDWRLPEHRREAFQRSYSFSLRHRSFPGMVYSMLPAIAEAFDLDEDGRAWLVWLNGNTQNVVSSLLLLEAAPSPDYWPDAIAFWNDNFKALEWDTDRRHQKAKFGEATEKFMTTGWGGAEAWHLADLIDGWRGVWKYSFAQPHMGRLSAWSMMEYARILLGPVMPDIGSWMLEDKSGSQSHRNGLAFIAGYDSVYWDAGAADMLGLVPELNTLAESLLTEAVIRNATDTTIDITHVSRLTMESALCTYKSWHKPNRRYPNCYADMMYNRIRKAEVRFNTHLELLWEIRERTLPRYLRLEDNPRDPGLAPVKQNHYRETGEPVMLSWEYPDMQSSFDERLRSGSFPERRDPSWKL